MIDSIHNKIVLSFRNNQSYEALNSARKLLELSVFIKNDSLKARSYIIIGAAFGDNNEHEQAIFYFNKALKIYLDINNLAYISGCYNDIGNIYIRLNQYDEAISLFDKALLYAKRTNSKLALYLPLRNLGLVYYKKGSYRQAINYYKKALIITDELGIYKEQLKSTMFNEIAKSYGKLKENSNAETNFNEAIKLALRGNEYKILYEAYAWKTKHYENNNNLKMALKYRDSMYIYNDSLKAELYENTKKGFVEKRLLKETEEKLKAVENKREVQTKLQRSRMYMVILLTIVLIGFIFFQRRLLNLKLKHNKILLNKNKQLNQSIRKKEELEKRIQKIQFELAKDLHDNFGNRLSGIITAVDVLRTIQKNKEESRQERYNEFLNLFSKNSILLIEDLKDLIWANNPDNNNLRMIIKRFEAIISTFNEHNNIPISYTANIEEDIFLPALWNRQLLMIFKEAITNALKHSQATKISFSIELTSDCKILMRIEDNGIGFKRNELKRKSGITNIYNRAKSIDFKTKIKSDKGIGTSIEFSSSMLFDKGLIKSKIKL